MSVMVSVHLRDGIEVTANIQGDTTWIAINDSSTGHFDFFFYDLEVWEDFNKHLQVIGEALKSREESQRQSVGEQIRRSSGESES